MLTALNNFKDKLGAMAINVKEIDYVSTIFFSKTDPKLDNCEDNGERVEQPSEN